tara:strand:- start:381 stop:1376 length:996 start_codon:yes stop_codon:yes gene_type:complete
MKKAILVTGSNGEIGSQLLASMQESPITKIALDINESMTNYNNTIYIKDSITNGQGIKKLFNKFEITEVYHFAALLSQTAMENPQLAKEINEEGSKLIIDTAFESGNVNKNFVKFFFPSSIAVYGPRKLIEAQETDIMQPTTIYGKNKLIIERYGTKKYEESHNNNAGIDFRSIRFPGIISPYTIPNGGTTDFAPQMLHAAAVFLLKNGKKEYECKISADTKLPFIGIEQAISAIIKIMNMKKIASQLRSFNIQEISLTPSEIIHTIKKEFPNFNIKYNVEQKLQSVADTWPDSLNCEKAKKEWNFSTQYDYNSFFMDYLIPKIKKHYERN